MKNLKFSPYYTLCLFACSLMAAMHAGAQERSTESQTTVTSTTVAPMDIEELWYNAPWVWVAGAALLLIIILWAAFRKSPVKREITRTTTVTTEVID